MATKTKAKKWTHYSACACVEGFDDQQHTMAETTSAWQYLIDTGACWTLQGWYGRTAQALIDSGMCHKKTELEYER
jgi:hypothetical protein